MKSILNCSSPIRIYQFKFNLIKPIFQSYFINKSKGRTDTIIFLRIKIQTVVK